MWRVLVVILVRHFVCRCLGATFVCRRHGATFVCVRAIQMSIIYLINDKKSS